MPRAIPSFTTSRVSCPPLGANGNAKETPVMVPISRPVRKMFLPFIPAPPALQGKDFFKLFVVYHIAPILNRQRGSKPLKDCPTLPEEPERVKRHGYGGIEFIRRLYQF
jgi:hypothetical protein